MRYKTMNYRQLRAAVTFSAALLLAVLLALVSGSQARAAFGITAFDQQITSDAGGDPFVQAGGHPYAISTTIVLNSHVDPNQANALMPDADAKDVVTELPPGLFGNVAGVAQCSQSQLSGAGNAVFPKEIECPIASQVGIIKLVTGMGTGEALLAPESWEFPLYNMVPAANVPAEFGFSVVGENITITGSVRNGGDFGINVDSNDIPIAAPLDSIDLTFWGSPADKSHDYQRCDWGSAGLWNKPFHRPSSGRPECPGEPGEPNGPNVDPERPKAFLTLPVSCTAPGVGFKTHLRVDSWVEPGVWSEADLSNHLAPSYPAPSSEWGPQQALVGCDRVPFNPSVTVEPSNHQADTPAGLSVEFKLPQDGLLNPSGIATSEVKKTVVTLPAGISVSPSAASGLEGCSLAQIGLHDGGEPSCPDGSKIGSVEIESPLMEETLSGPVYLAKQNENPFGSLMAIYLVAKAHGVELKLSGRVELNSVTGQLVTTVDNSPQLPFSSLKVDFKGGPRSPLVNPHTCGTYTASAQLTPWSGNAPVNIAGSFQITSGPNGSACPAPAQFAPGFTAGTVDNQAGGYSPLTLTMSRADGDQQLGGVTIHTPSGLLGRLSAVALCGEPQASQGTCGSDSQIGELTAAAGAGPNPFYVTGGKVYITGPYHGAPFGLSVVVPAKAGPFDLGNVIVRGTINVDPHTAALTVTTGALPTILQGIPLDLRVINVSIDRPGFMFNPTNCDPLHITGTLTGGQGLTEPVGSPFQVTNCAVLGFKPSFKVTTNGKTSRANGASLDATVVYPKDALGKQSNLAKVKVSLPKQLPSRLGTLQKACPAATFEANPAACPAPSRIGSAVVHTQVLPVPLTGPAYFVSHGGQAFPDLVVVLQGDGVTVDLVGTTFINKQAITSTTFNTVPDVPFETFQLKLPQGPYSALAANGNLCTSSLKMPTLFIAQDGTTIKQSTPITTTGCNRHKPHKHHKHHKKKKK